jgi:hypothetical protein
MRLHALTIARFTVHEAISRRLVLSAAILSLIFVGLFALGFSFVFTNAPPFARGAASPNEVATAGTVLTVLGLYAVHFLSSFVALFLTVAPSPARSTPARSTRCWPARSAGPMWCSGAGWRTLA